MSVERIRQRFIAALQDGHSTEAATEIANRMPAPSRAPGALPPPTPQADDFKVGKGPGGRIYIKDGKAIHSGPFDSEGLAEQALADLRTKAASAAE